MNVLYCGDRNIESGLIISILSLLKNAKTNLKVYVLTINSKEWNIDGVTDKCINVLDNKMKLINKENSIKKFDITEIFEKELPAKNMKTRFTPCCMLRLFADEIPELPDKILYLDIDIMVGNDLTKLYNIDITNYEYAAVKEKYGCWIIRPDYINAGMLLLNMKKIKETGLLEKARNLLKRRKLLFADQDAIFWSTTKKLILPRIYNEQSKFNKKDTVICHFCKRLMFRPYPHTENYKQWNIEEVHKILKCFYFDKDLEEYSKLKAEFENKELERR